VLYLPAGGVLAEKAIGSGGTITWNNYLFVAGKMVGMRVESGGGAVQTRYFHRDHLGSVAILTNETGAVVERLSYDAWGKRRQPNGADDPAGALTSQTTRGFTGHEQLDDVGLIHMNGRVYDPLLGRFGTPDPMTESPFSTQGWNRYTYVGNSPLNFTDPSGYCWAGCFWQKPFKALGKLFNKIPILGQILQIAAVAICSWNPVCAPLAFLVAGGSSAFVAGVRSGNLGQALRAGLISVATAAAFNFAGDISVGAGPLGKIAAHAAVGCGTALLGGGKCGAGALSAGVPALAGPILPSFGIRDSLLVRSVVGGLASVAGGGSFGNGALTAAFAYLFNDLRHCAQQAAAACLTTGSLFGLRALAAGPQSALIVGGGSCLAGAAVVGGACALGSAIDAWRQDGTVLWNQSSDVLIDDKIAAQLKDRGWTEQEVQDLAGGEPAGTATDNRQPNKTPDGQGRIDAASVYGTPDAHIVVNDRTREIVQVSDKTNPGWVPDSRIHWK